MENTENTVTRRDFVKKSCLSAVAASGAGLYAGLAYGKPTATATATASCSSKVSANPDEANYYNPSAALGAYDAGGGFSIKSHCVTTAPGGPMTSKTIDFNVEAWKTADYAGTAKTSRKLKVVGQINPADCSFNGSGVNTPFEDLITTDLDDDVYPHLGWIEYRRKETFYYMCVDVEDSAITTDEAYIKINFYVRWNTERHHTDQNGAIIDDPLQPEDLVGQGPKYTQLIRVWKS